MPAGIEENYDVREMSPRSVGVCYVGSESLNFSDFAVMVSLSPVLLRYEATAISFCLEKYGSIAPTFFGSIECLIGLVYPVVARRWLRQR